mgnify:CR=1 FL=1
MSITPVLRPYQRDGIRHLLTTPDACLFECPGLGKTLQGILAYVLLKRQEPNTRMLVVAPLRVAQTVWRQEFKKWEPSADLKVELLHGATKDYRLKIKADVHVINYEGLAWLERRMKGQEWPWDIVLWDELTKCKSVGTQRARWITRHYDKFDRHWGFTGTPMATKGYMDLFGQIRTIDGGKALGTAKYAYENMYFYYASPYDREPTIKRGASEVITRRISPLVYQLKAEDHLEMPELLTVHHDVEMAEIDASRYHDLERSMAISVGDSEITAVSAGVLHNKLKQLVQGFSFDDEGGVIWHNETKMEALEDIVEESAGAPVLVFYHFQPELAALLKRFPQGVALRRSGAEKLVQEWNEDKIPLMFASPLSAGHGLNLQLGSANQIVWLCQNGSPEIYQQANGRLYRSGQKNKTVVVHHLNATSPQGSTVDDDIISMLKNRTTVQEAMLRRLSSLQRQRACASG